MKQNRYRTKHYSNRIYEALKKEDPIKYRHVTRASIHSYVNHINLMILAIFRTANDEFESQYFKFKRALLNPFYFITYHHKYNMFCQRRQAKRVHLDNVIDQLDIDNIDYDKYNVYDPNNKASHFFSTKEA